MKQKKIFFRSIALLLVVTISYIQLIQFGHSFHHRFSSLTESGSKHAQIQTLETSCLVCDYLLHTQSKHNCTAIGTSLLSVHRDVSDLLSFYTVGEFAIVTKQSNNKSPPLG